VSKLREHLERRDLGVDHVVVFVDELNKYAPVDGPDTYVRRMLLDLSERGRYLGLVLFSAQQFRSQVQRRVVGNAGTVIYGRMDVDELATPGYSTTSPATKIKLATLPKGELMLRHPHFTQPIFVTFPRPAVLNSREGIERFPPAAELPFADAVARQLRQLDRKVSGERIRELIEGRREEDVRRALAATRRERPADAESYFTACLGRRITGELVSARRGIPALKQTDESYGS
jgi:DNA helicase HerA-like ATPase